MRFESEIVAEEILPAIRKIIADRLHYDYGYTQEEVARKLEVTQPAVSQYLKGQRSEAEVVDTLKEDPQTDVILDELVSKAAKDRNFSEDVRHVVQTARDKGLFQERFGDADRCL